MGGMKWRNAVNGSKSLIQYIKDHHTNKSELQLVVIQFDDEAHLKHLDSIDKPITGVSPEIMAKYNSQPSTDIWKAN